MKLLMIFATAVLLSSCNTTIGVYRDLKGGFNWTKEKMQGTGGGGGTSGGSQGDDYIY